MKPLGHRDPTVGSCSQASRVCIQKPMGCKINSHCYQIAKMSQTDAIWPGAKQMVIWPGAKQVVFWPGTKPKQSCFVICVYSRFQRPNIFIFFYKCHPSIVISSLTWSPMLSQIISTFESHSNNLKIESHSNNGEHYTH